MNEHVMSIPWLLESWEYCMGDKGGHSCTGCPNAIPGTEDTDGFCECKINLKKATMAALRAIAEDE